MRSRMVRFSIQNRRFSATTRDSWHPLESRLRSGRSISQVRGTIPRCCRHHPPTPSTFNSSRPCPHASDSFEKEGKVEDTRNARHVVMQGRKLIMVPHHPKKLLTNNKTSCGRPGWCLKSGSKRDSEVRLEGVSLESNVVHIRGGFTFSEMKQ